MNRSLIAACVLAGLTLTASPAYAGDDPDFKEKVKLSKGSAKISFTAIAPTIASVPAGKTPRIGLGTTDVPSFIGYIGQSLERTGKVSVVSARQLQMPLQAMPIATMLDSEARNMVAGACKRGKLDLVLFVNTSGYMHTKTDFGAHFFGLGKTRFRTPMEARMYDCKTGNIAWQQKVMTETSRSVAGMAFSGSTNGLTGGPEAERALAEIFAKKLVNDLL